MKHREQKPVRLSPPLTELPLGPRVRVALALGFTDEFSVRQLNRKGRRALERSYRAKSK